MSLVGNIKWHTARLLTRLKFARRGVDLGRGCIFSRHARIAGCGVTFGAYCNVDERAIVVGSHEGKQAVWAGDSFHLWPNALLDSAGGSIQIGNNVSIGSYTEVYGHGGCTIGDDCQIAGHCYIISANHNFEDPNIPVRLQGYTYKGVVIEEDCWLGHGVSVLDGVRIGRGSVIGASAVVTKDIPPYSIAVGIPAKVIGKRGDTE